jgi:hypothetical protein
MTINDEGKQLRLEIAKLRPDKRRRYSSELRRRILGWVERAVAAGMIENECTKMLGIRTWRLVLWRRLPEPPPKTERESLALVRVETSSLPMSSGASLVTPAGYRVEGLLFDQLVALLRELA